MCSERIFNFIESLEVTGVKEDEQIDFEVMDLSSLDQTLLLPLWAGIPDPERAHQLIQQTVTHTNLFWKPWGIQACPQGSKDPDHPCYAVHMIWNSLIGEGLLNYDFRQEAADLVSKLMQVAIQNLKKNNSFYNYYHAETGRGLGERNSLGGSSTHKTLPGNPGCPYLFPL